ncbi:agmatine deiminase family protein [Sandaracinomonas limnophila]|uniref:Agmatine deiminase family protein n=1 Tax=Sandaracinomonas limnophila TaxID=1862386 RepID=A0A437PXG6_9BACT|nr:agmatine deiminase family protein [Sandaracinomonas limnophila]RVU26947.1 agmatine deiminase family protein [Sandaracinomonas limnophila]
MNQANKKFYFPAEWHPHKATWITFPHNDHSWQGDKLQGMYPEYFALIREISKGEKVCINVNSEELEIFIQSQLTKYEIDANQIIFHRHKTNDAWCRDHGPAFLIDRENKEKLIVDWGYNAWGGKYPPYNDDNDLPNAIAQFLKLPSVSPGIVMEGGSVEFNGKGTVLTSRSCLLNPNRNPHLNQAQIEQYLKDFYGVEQVLWVSDGIVGDDTDGHIDDTVRFVNEDTVVAVVENNPSDDNYKVLQKNLSELKEMKLLNGKSLNIVELPMPDAVVIDDFRAPGSYANFYICNAGVLVPIFDCPQDEIALNILRGLFTDRPVVGLSAKQIIWGQGSFHCLTQQEPDI